MFYESVPDVSSTELSSSAYGALAEHMAVTELLRRGFKVARPVVDDDGVDLIVDYRITVQVKNSYRRAQIRNGRSYTGWSWGSKGTWQEAQVFILHGSSGSGSRWWIVPRGAFRSGRTLTVYEGMQRGVQQHLAAFEDCWEVFRHADIREGSEDPTGIVGRTSVGGEDLWVVQESLHGFEA